MTNTRYLSWHDREGARKVVDHWLHDSSLEFSDTRYVPSDTLNGVRYRREEARIKKLMEMPK